jgi:hypothetical protein
MITVVYNDVLKSIDVMMDHKGVDLLIETLQTLRTDNGHIHLYATDDDRGLSTTSPYAHAVVYRQLVLELLPSEAWTDSEQS